MTLVILPNIKSAAFKQHPVAQKGFPQQSLKSKKTGKHHTKCPQEVFNEQSPGNHLPSPKKSSQSNSVTPKMFTLFWGYRPNIAGSDELPATAKRRGTWLGDSHLGSWIKMCFMGLMYG